MEAKTASRDELEVMRRDAEEMDLDWLGEACGAAMKPEPDRLKRIGHYHVLEAELGRRAMRELVEWMGSLPGRYGCATPEKYVLGHEPSTVALSEQERRMLEEWRGFGSRAQQVMTGVVLARSLFDLVGEVAHFAAERHAFALYVRRHQHVVETRRLPFSPKAAEEVLLD